MKYKGLALTTAVALTASLFSVPVHAEDSIINVSEIHLDNVIMDVTEGEKPTFTAKVTLVTDHDEAIAKLTTVEYYSTLTNVNGTNYSFASQVSSNGYTTKDKNGNPLPTFDTFKSTEQYKYSINVSIDFIDGYSTSIYDMPKLYINGVQKKNIDGFAANKGMMLCSINSDTFTTVKDGSMFRLYNPNTGEHFYTSGAEERLIDMNAGWNYEGVGWVAPSTGTPVMRMYNPVAGEHHYTTSKDEANNLVAAGWNLESDCAWYSAPAETGTPVYREYNPNAYSCNHNYTPSQEENDNLVNAGWQYEGIAWYAAGM